VAAGFDVARVEKNASFGRVHLVARSNGGWQGVADPDWEGSSATIACTLD
jgi:gamma-glutamyltranspeptidase